MQFQVLSSGSKGNLTYIKTDECNILIDAGISLKEISNRSDINIKEIDAIFITHTHVDHIKGLKVFVNKYGTKVYFTDKMHKELNFVENFEYIIDNKIYFKEMVINVIKTSHDSDDSLGYVIEGDNKSVVYITDTGYINSKYFDLLKNRNVYIMESNHDIEMLNNGRYSFSLRQRILGDKGHLSNYDSARYLASFIGENTDTIILAHLSEENNTSEIAYDTLIKRLDGISHNVRRIIIAKQDVLTEEIVL